MAPRGLFVGLATLDLVQRVARAPGVDEKVVASRSDIAAGGPAATAAVTFAALGGHAVLVSALGPGPVGRLAADDLHRAGVRVVDCWAAGADLSVSAITVLDGTGQRSVVSRNAEDVRADAPADLGALLGEAQVLLCDGHHPALATAAAAAARDAGVPVLLDCGSAKPVYAQLLPCAEAAICSAGFTVGAAAGFDAVARSVLAAGTRLVAMTAGADPIRWRTAGAAGTVAVPATSARDTLGAGDVLHGAAAFARAGGVERPDPMLRFGAGVASLRVQHAGPRSWLADPRLRRLSPEG